jgi:hypothetical protein
MFGFLKNKSEEKKFISELEIFSSRFDYVVKAVDPKGANELMISRAINNYKERTPEEMDHTASDFYLNAFTGAIFELTDNSIITPESSLKFFSMTDNFLDGHGIYQTPLAMQLMDTWQSILIDLGIIEN